VPTAPIFAASDPEYLERATSCLGRCSTPTRLETDPMTGMLQGRAKAPLKNKAAGGLYYSSSRLAGWTNGQWAHPERPNARGYGVSPPGAEHQFQIPSFVKFSARRSARIMSRLSTSHNARTCVQLGYRGTCRKADRGCARSRWPFPVLPHFAAIFESSENKTASPLSTPYTTCIHSFIEMIHALTLVLPKQSDTLC